MLIPLLHPQITTLRRQLKARLKPPTTPIISMPPQRILPRKKPPAELTLMISLLLMHTQMMSLQIRFAPKPLIAIFYWTIERIDSICAVCLHVCAVVVRPVEDLVAAFNGTVVSGFRVDLGAVLNSFARKGTLTLGLQSEGAVS